MRRFRDAQKCIIEYLCFYGDKYFGNKKWFNQTVRIFYLFSLVPLCEYVLKKTVKNGLKRIKIRHSIASANDFNAFLSDIDVNLIFYDKATNVDIDKVVKMFLLLKKIFIVFDYPEIYLENEEKLLENIMSKSEWEYINFFWHFRKTNWNYQGLLLADSELSRHKKIRSIIKSRMWIMGDASNVELENQDHDICLFKSIGNLIPCVPGSDKVIFENIFLETDKGIGVRMKVSESERIWLTSFLPGESIDFRILDKIDEKYLEAKKSLTTWEWCLSKSSLRLCLAQGNIERTHALDAWIVKLSNSANINEHYL